MSSVGETVQMLSPATLCAFLISGGVLYDSHLGRDFRDKLQSVGAFYIYELESEWKQRMERARNCGRLPCESSRLKAIDEMSYKDVFILREPIPKEKLGVFGCNDDKGSATLQQHHYPVAPIVGTRPPTHRKQ